MSDFPDLRSFLEDVKAKMPDQLLEIGDEVPVDYTSTALVMALEKKGQYPIVILNHLQNSNMRMVANLFGSRKMMSYSIGTDEQNFNDYFGKRLDHLLPSQKTKDGPVQEVILKDEELDLMKLPIPRHFRDDAGPYITGGMVAARDPDTGVGNLAYARLQVVDAHTMGVSLHSRQHLWDYHRRAELVGKDLPVAIVVGAHPAIMVAAAAKMGIDQDEYDLAGALLNQPVPLCKAQTVDVDVPANAEIVIEGYILANERGHEGPFGEYTGYTTGRSTHNVMKVTAITMRKDAIFVDVVPGNSTEHLTLGRACKEAWVHKRMKEALPFFVDFHYPTSGTHFHCYIRIDKSAEGQAKQAAELLLGLDHYVKMAIVVDKDIDPSSESEVLWALATRMQAHRDVDIISGVICNHLDPSSEDGKSAKMLIDATAPLDATARRVVLTDEAQALASQLLSKYL